jgi:hypothetical protein
MNSESWYARLTMRCQLSPSFSAAATPASTTCGGRVLKRSAFQAYCSLGKFFGGSHQITSMTWSTRRPWSCQWPSIPFTPATCMCKSYLRAARRWVVLIDDLQFQADFPTCGNLVGLQRRMRICSGAAGVPEAS